MGVFTITILNDGQKVDDSYILNSLDIQHEVNKIPYARLSFVDGNPSKQSFDLSNSPSFVPGQEIEIKVRYEADARTETSLFKGLIVKHIVEAGINASMLNIELKDTALKMTTIRKNRVFRDQEEEAVFRELIESNGLKVDKMAPAKAIHQELIQYYCSDWDFLLGRADLYGWWVNVWQGSISLINPADINTSNSDHRFSYGLDNIFDLHLEINAESQIGQVNSFGWDLPNQATTQATQGASFNTGIGDLKAEDLAVIVNADNYQLQSLVSLVPEELQIWSDSKIRKTRLAMIRGRFTVRGIPKIQLMEVMEIAGISTRFNGKAIISGIRHRISEEGWFTDVQFGLQPDRYIDQFPPEEKLASGLIPPVQGLQIGIIDAFEADPDEQLRVKVKLPALGEEAGAVWARLASPDAGNQRGFFFRPETGDEVIVGFLNNDPRQAIILGGLFSQAIPPPIESDQVDETNPLKGIFSREGLQLKIDDENQVLQILTSADQAITLNQSEEFIEMQDVHGNKIKMDKDGIQIISSKDVVIEAANNVEIKGKKVDVK